jgi:hypothetical protein
MNPEREGDRCPVCGQPTSGETVICSECEKAFGRTEEPAAGEGIDLERYVGKMFPWEPSKIAPNLISGRRAALLLCFALVVIVVLLSLLRAPIPSCWEVG